MHIRKKREKENDNFVGRVRGRSGGKGRGGLILHLERSSSLGKAGMTTHQNMDTYIAEENSNPHFFLWIHIQHFHSVPSCEMVE